MFLYECVHFTVYFPGSTDKKYFITAASFLEKAKIGKCKYIQTVLTHA